MAELLDYDDDPAATAAEQWVRRTKVGRSTRRLATNAPAKIVERMLLRACRAGWLLRDKEVRRETNEIETLRGTIKLLLGQQADVPWRQVADSDVDTYVLEYNRLAAEAKEDGDG